MAGGDRFADAAHLPAEAEVLIAGAELVSVKDDDGEHADGKGNGHHPESRGTDASPGRREGGDRSGGLRGAWCRRVFCHVEVVLPAERPE
jgi:hypothetical protein